MTNFLFCLEQKKRVHIDVCKSKCEFYDECELRESFEVEKLLANERQEEETWKEIKRRSGRF